MLASSPGSSPNLFIAHIVKEAERGQPGDEASYSNAYALLLYTLAADHHAMLSCMRSTAIKTALYLVRKCVGKTFIMIVHFIITV